MTFCLTIYMRSSKIYERRSVLHPLLESSADGGVARLYPSNSAPELGHGRLTTWRMNVWVHVRLDSFFFFIFLFHDVFTACVQMCFGSLIETAERRGASRCLRSDIVCWWSSQTNKPSKSISNIMVDALLFHSLKNREIRLSLML